MLHFQCTPVLPENDLHRDTDILEIYIEVTGATDWDELEELPIPSKNKNIKARRKPAVNIHR